MALADTERFLTRKAVDANAVTRMQTQGTSQAMKMVLNQEVGLGLQI